MSRAEIGFIIWAVVGVAIIGIGIWDLFSKKAVGFWANADTLPVKDVKGYNRATGRLFMAYGAIFILLGLPLLGGQNSPFILLTAVGVMFETIATMAIYTLVIEKKYGEK